MALSLLKLSVTKSRTRDLFESALRIKSQINPSNVDSQSLPLDKTSAGALLYLGCPILIFFLGWFELPIALILLTVSGIGLRHAMAVTNWHWASLQTRDNWAMLAIIVGTATLWSTFGGAGHFFYANFDWLTRDAVLRDLTMSDWPPSYGSDGVFEHILRAPVTYYLPAAAMGKILGVAWADWLLWIWTILGVSVFFALLPLPASLARSALLLAMVTLFSGMDVVGWTTLSGELPRVGQHIEWWARYFQYSSNSTQLFWVPNHALPGWIAITLFYRHWRHPDFSRFAPMLFAMLPLWSPFAAIGMLPFYGLVAVRAFREQQFFSIVNLLPAIGILALSGRYLTLDLFTVPAQSVFSMGSISVGFLLLYGFFVLLEFGLLCLVLYRSSGSLLLVIAFVTLSVLPMFRMGPGNDLVMRGSIPALMLICLLVIRHFQNERWSTPRSIAIGLLLMLGAITPLQEFYRAVANPAWNSDLQVNLIEASGGHAPSHYVARLNQAGLQWLMKPPSPVPGSAANNNQPKL